MYQYPASGRDMDTLRPVAGNAFDPRFPPPAAVRANDSDRGASATGWLVGLGSFAAVLLIGIGAMVNTNHANAASAAAASLPNAATATATAVPVLFESEPVVPTQAAQAAPPVAEETPAPVAPTSATAARKIKKPQPQRHVTAAPVTRPTPAPAAITRPAPAPRAPADASATKEAQETLIKAMAERPLS